MKFPANSWALILGGSSGFGLATAQKLARHGLNLCLVHRDRRGAMSRIDPIFEELKAVGPKLLTFNVDALDTAVRGEVLDRLATEMGSAGRVRVLLHSIAFGNLKLVAPQKLTSRSTLPALATALQIEPERLAAA